MAEQSSLYGGPMDKDNLDMAVEAYEDLPMISSNVQRTIIEDSMTALAAVFEGINHQIMDTIEIMESDNDDSEMP